MKKIMNIKRFLAFLQSVLTYLAYHLPGKQLSFRLFGNVSGKQMKKTSLCKNPCKSVETSEDNLPPTSTYFFHGIQSQTRLQNCMFVCNTHYFCKSSSHFTFQTLNGNLPWKKNRLNELLNAALAFCSFEAGRSNSYFSLHKFCTDVFFLFTQNKRVFCSFFGIVAVFRCIIIM